MFIRSNLSRSVRLAIAFGTASATAFFTPTAVLAEEDSADEAEKIQVTGSRIKRANVVSASPVMEISEQEIKLSGATRIEDILNDMPQIFANQNANVANGSTGTATIDLRNLGTERTLVLINGRRMPYGSPLAGGIGADINQIPAGLLKRVEILTGGASATYGSDAIGGVVNFILKDDFEGVQAGYLRSFYQHDNSNGSVQQLLGDNGYEIPNGSVTDGDTDEFTFMLGANSDDGKGNITLYATLRNVDPVLQADRDYSGCALGGTLSTLGCIGSSTIPQGRFTDFGLNANEDPDINKGNSVGFDFMVAGDEFVNRDGTTFNFGPLNYFQRPDERKSFGALGHFDFADNHTVYGEVSFMDDRSVAQIAPSGAFFVTDSLFCGNPFLSEQQFEAICGANGLSKSDTLGNLYIGRRNVEGAPRQDDLRHSSLRTVIGARGELNNNWSYDVSGNYGNVSLVRTYRNDLSITNIGRALDVTVDEDGNPVCRSALNGVDPNCVPWNVFTEGGVTQEAIDYISLPLFARGDTTTTQLLGYVTGDLTDAGVQLPGTSIGASLVVGFEHRREELLFEPDTNFASGDGAGQGGPTQGVSGDFDVNEFFAEFELPLIEDSGVESLSLNLGYRHSDYSTDKKTDTFKVALQSTISQDLSVRTSFQRAGRVGNVRELFRPATLGLFNMDTDPCAGANPAFSQEECARTGVSAAQYGSVPDNPAGQFNSITGGNADLDPEKSDTFSVGFVVTPNVLPELSVVVDYFKIKVDDAIDNIPETDILTQCAKEGNLCELINRGPSGSLWLGSDNIVATDINIGFFETEGFDIDLAYNIGLDDMGSVKVNLISTVLTKWDQQTIRTEPATDCLGFWDRSECGPSTAKIRYNLTGSWDTPWEAILGMTWRHFGAVDELGGGPDDIDAQNYLDLFAQWNPLESTTVTFGIDNVLDEEPPIVANAPAGDGNGNTFPGPYDALGRYIFAGVTYDF